MLDCSLPGAGNHHIANSLQWAIEVDKPNPADSLVIVMWSGNDRDDYISPIENSRNYSFIFKYDDNIISGITGGASADSRGNTRKGLLDLANTKTVKSRAIENYLYIVNLWNFLQNKGYKFLFLDYIDRSLPSRTVDFDIKEYLPSDVGVNLTNMITNVMTPYNWAIKHNLLTEDDFHPSPDGHLDWTRTVLLPKLQAIID